MRYSDFRSIEVNIFCWQFTIWCLALSGCSNQLWFVLSIRPDFDEWEILFILFLMAHSKSFIPLLCTSGPSAESPVPEGYSFSSKVHINISSTPTVFSKHLLCCTSLLNHIRYTAFMPPLISLYGSQYFVFIKGNYSLVASALSLSLVSICDQLCK